MSAIPEQPRDYPKLDQQDWAEVAKHTVEGISPGWVLAIVIMFLGMTSIDYFAQARQAETLAAWLDNGQEFRSQVEDNRSRELRRCQEVLKGLSETIARNTDRVSRAKVKSAKLREPGVMSEKE